MKKLVIFLGVALFIGVVVYSTIAPAQVECEVCMEFDGERVCRMGAGESEASAAQAAQESVCGGNAFGMSEVIVCRGSAPLSVTCAAR